MSRIILWGEEDTIGVMPKLTFPCSPSTMERRQKRAMKVISRWRTKFFLFPNDGKKRYRRSISILTSKAISTQSNSMCQMSTHHGCKFSERSTSGFVEHMDYNAVGIQRSPLTSRKNTASNHTSNTGSAFRSGDGNLESRLRP